MTLIQVCSLFLVPQTNYSVLLIFTVSSLSQDLPGAIILGYQVSLFALSALCCVVISQIKSILFSMINVVFIFPSGFQLMLWRISNWMPVCKCFTISYNDHRWIRGEAGTNKRKKKKKPMTASCPLEPKNSTEINMCRIQWAKDVFSKVTQGKAKFPTHQSLRKEE